MAFHREVWVVFSGLIAFVEEDNAGTKEVSKAILVRDRDHSPSMFLCGEEVTLDGRRVEIKWLSPPPGAPRTTRRSTTATGKLPRSPKESEDFRWVPSAADLGLGRADGKLIDDEIDDAGLARVRAKVTWDHGELCVGHLVAYPPPHDEQDEAPVPAVEFPVAGQIETNQMARPGDSGSALLCGDRLVGITFAGGRGMTFHNPVHDLGAVSWWTLD
jgi:hypothetical protein